MSVNIFDLSDEELLKMDLSTIEGGVNLPGASGNDEESSEELQQNGSDEQATGENSVEDASTEANENSSGDAEDEASAAEAESEADAQDTSATQNPHAASVVGNEVNTAEPTGSKTEAKDAPVEKKEAQASTDYESEYKKLLAPFQANGREMQVQTVDEAIQLMQMGANYNKKMAALKPNLKLLKLLETHGLNSEEKISYLIDLVNKDPKAVNKLVKDSGIDPMDLNAEKADEYRPNVRTVSDKEMELDAVLEDIASSKHYQRTLNVVGKDWDGASRQVVADTPQLLKIINDHMDSGIFDMITAEVERERTFGRLRGLSDIEAYKQVGDAINAKGGFNHLSNTRNAQGNGNTPQQVIAPPKPKVDEKLNEKRRAAAPAKPAVASNKPLSDFNPLSMSDEEFAKLNPKFV